MLFRSSRSCCRASCSFISSKFVSYTFGASFSNFAARARISDTFSSCFSVVSTSYGLPHAMSECVRANQFFSVRLLRAISMARCDASRHAGHNLCASCVSVGFPHRLHIPGQPSMSRGMTPFSLNRDCMYRRLRARQYTHCARPGAASRRWHLTQTPKACSRSVLRWRCRLWYSFCSGLSFFRLCTAFSLSFSRHSGHCTRPGAASLQPHVGHIPCALYHSYFVTACFTSFAALCIFPGLGPARHRRGCITVGPDGPGYFFCSSRQARNSSR